MQQARTRARVAARDAETKPYLVDIFLRNDPGTGTESRLDLLNSYVLVMNLFHADMQDPHEDIITLLYNHLEKHFKKDVKKHIGCENNFVGGKSFTCTVTLFGVPVTAVVYPPLNGKDSKKKAFCEAVIMWQQLPCINLDLQSPVQCHKPILSVPSVSHSSGDYVRTLDEVLVALWLIVKKFEDAAALLRASGSGSEGLNGQALEQQEKAMKDLKLIALSDSHRILISPGHILGMLGRDKIKTQDLNNAAAALLLRWAKKFEIGNSHRMGQDHNGLMVFASRISAPFLLLCGPPKSYLSLAHFLDQENVWLTNIMDEQTFIKIH